MTRFLACNSPRTWTGILSYLQQSTLIFFTARSIAVSPGRIKVILTTFRIWFDGFGSRLPVHRTNFTILVGELKGLQQAQRFVLGTKRARVTIYYWHQRRY